MKPKLERQWYELLRWTEMQIMWHNKLPYDIKQKIRELGLYKQAV